MSDKILIVDDEPSNRKILVQELTHKGFAVDTAGGGHEALAKIESASPDLVILDYMMPDLSGLEIVAEPPRFRTFVVNAVEENSPAAAAGIQEEDTILAIDGQPAVGLTLKELRHLLTQPGEHVLKIRHNSKTIQVRLRL